MKDKNYDFSEQRKSNRLIENIDVRVKKLTYPLSEGDGELAQVRNIGKKGLCFEIENSYPLETMLCLQIHWFGWQRHKKSLLAKLDDDSISAPLTLIAEVIWCRPSDHPQRFEIGVQFRDAHGDDYNAFKDHIDSLTLN